LDRRQATNIAISVPSPSIWAIAQVDKSRRAAPALFTSTGRQDAMAQMTERTAELLNHTQAVELARVIDLQAQWENLRDAPNRARTTFSTPDLQGRQKAYESFRTRMVAYSTRFKTAEVPELTLNAPDRVGAWCRTVRAVFARAIPTAASECPTQTVAKAYRLADRIAARLNTGPVEQGLPPSDVADAIHDLGTVIQWCEGLSSVATPTAEAAVLAEQLA
jgi:hypothetical protein